MKVAIAQLNPIVGHIEGNLAKLEDTLERTHGRSPDLVVFPELFLIGYPPRDLVERPWFVEQCDRALKRVEGLSRRYPQAGILIGTLSHSENAGRGTGLHNSAALIYQGRTLFRQHKTLLPTYDVFDEARYFDPAPAVQVVRFKDELLGVTICEDAWNDPELWPRSRIYSSDPLESLARLGASLFINISASPFHMGKEELRYRLIRNHALRHHTPFVYVNQIGGNDELIFDGRSLCLDARGDLLAVGPAFQEHVEMVDAGSAGKAGVFTPQDRIASVHDALVLGIRDYLHKCGFSKAVIGLSGGIDSAVVCCLAATALGSENILGISMPSPFSSRGSVEDSRRLADNLGIEFLVIPISDLYHSYLRCLEPHFAGQEQDVAEENIQARIRGNILMAFSNKFGHLVLSTGNKSELAVGYCTLYGDMSGGLSVLSDVPKTLVYDLARYINRAGETIPQQIIDKPPSAELRPNQTDQDTLPPYPILDEILYYYIEEAYSAEQIIARGMAAETVHWVIRTVNRNEYKRRQAAPGLKVTTKAFGVGRRMPIAARFGP